MALYIDLAYAKENFLDTAKCHYPLFIGPYKEIDRVRKGDIFRDFVLSLVNY
jgi:hypothetical protein